MVVTSSASGSVRNTRLWAFIISLKYHPGFLPLDKIPGLRLLGGDQFRKFCVVGLIVLTSTVWMTCYYNEEEARPNEYRQPQRSGLLRVVNIIFLTSRQ